MSAAQSSSPTSFRSLPNACEASVAALEFQFVVVRQFIEMGDSLSEAIAQSQTYNVEVPKFPTSLNAMAHGIMSMQKLRERISCSTEGLSFGRYASNPPTPIVPDSPYDHFKMPFSS
ncbi:hypothetical protein XA68_14183 [Ophiocordyceps unilateralis]|uniref:Uncharacterized protein n=1 Tax=Ophiocordyceps unilateralis TaxID=268505 RepID=A0A2A9PN45_OPHUN|nr:hypothetical protein XA68_14183 [Ophiocordyceps unilateralis]